MIACTQKWLREHPESCLLTSHGDSKVPANRPHEHGSSRCVSAFLGPENWTQSTVNRLLVVDKLDDSVKDVLTAYDSTSSNPNQREGRIGLAAVPALAKLEKPAQAVFHLPNFKTASRTHDTISTCSQIAISYRSSNIQKTTLWSVNPSLMEATG